MAPKRGHPLSRIDDGRWRLMSQQAKVWLNTDVGGLITATITHALLLLVAVGLLFALDFNRPVDFLYALVYNGLAVTAAACHLRAMLTDPGSMFES